jgi:hypothetical protein
MAHGNIVERVGKRVWMIESFRERKPSRLEVVRSLPVAGHLQRKRTANMRANPRIMAAEDLGKLAVPIHIVAFDPETAIGNRARDIAPKDSCGPAAVISFE